MKIAHKPINGILEPDFLHYLEDTFSKWNKLFEDKVTLGTREIAKLDNIITGARLNARFGFAVIRGRQQDEETNQETYVVQIFKNEKEIEQEKEPLISFSAPIYR